MDVTARLRAAERRTQTARQLPSAWDRAKAKRKRQKHAAQEAKEKKEAENTPQIKKMTRPKEIKKKNLPKIAGQAKAMKQLRQWVRRFREPGHVSLHPIVALTGKCGVGKTSACMAVCAEYGFHPVVVNASDVRSAREVRLFLERCAMGPTLRGPTALIFDEIDGMGAALREVAAFCKTHAKFTTRSPVLCTCNNWSALKPIHALCTRITFHKLFRADMLRLAKAIAPTLPSLNRVVAEADGDVRRLQNLLHLESLMPSTSTSTSSAADHGMSIFDTVKAMLVSGPDARTSRAFHGQASYGTALLHANYPDHVRNSHAAAGMADALADADILLWRDDHLNPTDIPSTLALAGLGAHTKRRRIRGMVPVPDGRFFLPMSKKIANLRLCHKFQCPDVMDALYIKNSGLSAFV